MAVGLFLSRGLAFVRDAVIGYRFGASAQTDAYLISAQVPLVFDSLLAGGALYNAFVPVAGSFSGGARPDDQRLARLVRNVSTLVLVVSGVVGVLGLLLSPWLAQLFGGGLSPEGYPIAVRLLALTMLSLPFIGLTNVGWAALNVKGRYWGSALSLSFNNIALITFALVLGQTLGIYALGIGYAVGVLAQVAAQYLELYRSGVPIRLGLNLRDPDLLVTLRAFWPLAIGGLVGVLSPTVDNLVATFLPSGGVTAIRYAYGLTVPFSVMSMALSVPVLPRLSRSVAQNDLAGIANLLQRGVSFLSLVLFGAAAWLIVVRRPLVALVYERGAFDQDAVQRTASALAMYAIAIPFASTYYFLQRGLLAFSKPRFILLLNSLALIVTLVLDLAFLPFLAEAGIGLASACVQLLSVLLALRVLNRALKAQHLTRRVLAPLMVNGIAALVAVSIAIVIGRMLNNSPGVYSWAGVAASQAIVVGVYLAISRILGFCDVPRELLPPHIRRRFSSAK